MHNFDGVNAVESISSSVCEDEFITPPNTPPHVKEIHVANVLETPMKKKPRNTSANHSDYAHAEFDDNFIENTFCYEVTVSCQIVFDENKNTDVEDSTKTIFDKINSTKYPLFRINFSEAISNTERVINQISDLKSTILNVTYGDETIFSIGIDRNGQVKGWGSQQIDNPNNIRLLTTNKNPFAKEDENRSFLLDIMLVMPKVENDVDYLLQEELDEEPFIEFNEKQLSESKSNQSAAILSSAIDWQSGLTESSLFFGSPRKKPKFSDSIHSDTIHQTLFPSNKPI